MSENEPKKTYIEPDDYLALLCARTRKFNNNIAAIARALGMTRAAVYSQLSGESGPSDELLAKLGAHWVICVDSDPELIDPEAKLPPKPKKKPAKKAARKKE